MKLIPLTQGQYALVDDDKYEWLSQWMWQAWWNKATKSFYARRGEHLGTIDGKQIQRTVLMHRQILGLAYGDPLKGDHRNRKDTLNNQISNLRRANDEEQMYNRGIQTNNTTGFKGISSNASGYVARIGVNGVQKYLGTRSTPEAAYHELYVPAALELHGEFACLA